MSFTQTDNSNYFKIWSPNMAYILGFFTGDGCLSTSSNGYRIVFMIHPKDVEILEFIKNEINPNRIIRYSNPLNKDLNKRYKKCSLFIGNQTICNDIISLGFKLRKTYNMSKIAIPEEFKYDYLRGLFDADGSLAICNRKESNLKRYIWSITSYESNFLKSLREDYNNIGRIDVFDNKISWKIDKQLEIREICDKMYNGNFCLNRKYLRYINMPKTKTNIKYSMFGESKYIYDWAHDNRCQSSPRNFFKRLGRGWTFEKAFLKPEKRYKI